MKIAPFATEQYYALYEFNAPHLLSVSDCETVDIARLLEMAGLTLDDLGELRLGYTESQGHPLLRETIAATYTGVIPDDVVVLATPVEGIYLTMQTLLEPGDEVVVLLPAYDALKNVVAHVAGQIHPWPLRPTAEGWRLDFDALAEVLSDRTRLIVVNFPHNPTGFLPSFEEFAQIIEMASQHNAWLFCDEIYRGLEFGEVPRLPSAAECYERSIVLAGLSKVQGLPGLRAGWLVIRDEEVRNNLINWKHYTSICAPAPSEWLAIAGIRAGTQLAARNQAIIRQNLRLATAFFERWSHFFTWRPPLAGSVALVGIDVPSAAAYCHELARSAGIVLLPSSFLGYGDHHVRFGFGRRSFPSALHHYEHYLLERLVAL